MITKKSIFFSFFISFLLVSSFSFAQSIGGDAYSVGKIIPICSDSSSDSDRDGWGWENMSSCHVDGHFEYQPRILCESSSSDPDGDGWGWENGESCRVDTSSPDSTVTEDQPSAQPTPTPLNNGTLSFLPTASSTLNGNQINFRINFAGKEVRNVRIIVGNARRFSGFWNKEISNGSYIDTEQIRVLNSDEILTHTINNLPVDGSNIEVTLILYDGIASPETIDFKYTAASSSTASNNEDDTFFDEPEPTVSAATPSTTTEISLNPSTVSGPEGAVPADLRTLSSRRNSLLNNGYRIGFGRNATGGNNRLVTVTNNRGDNSVGSFRRAVSTAQSGDYIIFDRSLAGRTINLESGASLRQSNVTIDGRIQGGGHVTITSGQMPIHLSINASDVIVHFLEFDSRKNSSPIFVRTGENIWLDALTLRNSNDDAIGLGFPPNGAASADLISVTRYHSVGNVKGFLVNSAAWTCRGVRDSRTGQLLNQSQVGQRRARVTLAYAHLDNNFDRNLRNSGGFVHAFNIWADDISLGMQASAGGETILESAYYDVPNIYQGSSRLTLVAGSGGASQRVVDLGEAHEVGGYTFNPRIGIPTCPSPSYLFIDDIITLGHGSSITNYVREGSGGDRSQVLVGRGNFGQAPIRPFNITYPYHLLGSEDVPRTLRGNVGINSNVN